MVVKVLKVLMVFQKSLQNYKKLLDNPKKSCNFANK